MYSGLCIRIFNCRATDHGQCVYEEAKNVKDLDGMFNRVYGICSTVFLLYIVS